MVTPNESPDDKPVITLSMPTGAAIHLGGWAILERYPHGWMLDITDDSYQYFIPDVPASSADYPA
jgi:hypothetical protein